MTTDDLSRGFGKLLDEVAFPSIVVDLLPATCDRFDEARFFGKLAAQVPAVPDQKAVVNWYVSAYMTATIGIFDAGSSDFHRLGRQKDFARAELAIEFFLRSDDPDPLLRDPLAVNRAYRDLRNLRVHHAKSLVQLDTRILEEDLGKNPPLSLDEGKPRWFLNRLETQDVLLLGKRAHVTQDELNGFNRWIDTRPLATALCQHLVVLANAIERTARSIPT